MRPTTPRAFNSRLTALNLRVKPARSPEREPVRVAVRMVFHAVTPISDTGNDVRVGFRPAANAEEGRSGASFLQ